MNEYINTWLYAARPKFVTGVVNTGFVNGLLTAGAVWKAASDVATQKTHMEEVLGAENYYRNDFRNVHY